MERKKNIRLLILFVILLAWTIVFANLKESESKLAVNETKFTVLDTTAVQKITIDKPGSATDISLEKKDNQWLVNDTFQVDPSMKKVLLAVLHEVRVRRTVPKNITDEIKTDLEKNGNRITVAGKKGSGITYLAGGNGISVSYFMYPGEDPYIVYLPGYESYVSGIFDVSENDWRDRMLFQTSWMGIRHLTIDYPEDPSKNITIVPEGNLYRVENITDLDTARLMEYFDQLSFFYTDQYIEHGQVPVYDSLLGTIPVASLSIDAVGLKDQITIDFFHSITGENVRLGLFDGKQMCLFTRKRIDFLFKSGKDFKLQ